MYSARYYIQLNGKEMMNGKLLKANDFSWPTAVIPVTDNALKLTAECTSTTDCHEIWSRVNAIEIKPAKDGESGGDSETREA
jgi:hypothetical protein